MDMLNTFTAATHKALSAKLDIANNKTLEEERESLTLVSK